MNGRRAPIDNRNVNATRPQGKCARHTPDEQPFWQRKSLTQMSAAEWESLCDSCGKCCLNKLEDWDTGAIHNTKVACRLLDGDTCRCRDYANRFDEVPECVQLDPKSAGTLPWLPPTCAYRLVAEGRPLPDWHHLVCGDPNAVHRAGMSVRGRTVSEEGLEPEDWEEHVVEWW